MKSHQLGIPVQGVTPYPPLDRVRTVSVCAQPTSLLVYASVIPSPYVGQ